MKMIFTKEWVTEQNGNAYEFVEDFPTLTNLHLRFSFLPNNTIIVVKDEILAISAIILFQEEIQNEKLKLEIMDYYLRTSSIQFFMHFFGNVHTHIALS
ncbi:MAG: hypothetical protein ACD_63C00166G0001, partial [uncultured bacterium]